MSTRHAARLGKGLISIATLLAAHLAWAQTPSVTLRATDSIASEPGADTGAFSITRSGSLDQPLDVAYTVGGTASNGVDYQALSGLATIPAGASNTTLVVQPIDDATPESSEYVTLTLKSATAYTLGASYSASVTILDNDNLAPAVTLTSPPAGSTFTGPTNITLEAQASDPDGWIRNINFFCNGVYIGSGGSTSSTPPSNAPAPGSVTTCSVVWSNVVGGRFVLSASAYDNLNLMVTSMPVTVVVTQNPAVAVVRVNAADAYAAEPGTDTATFVVYRTGATNQSTTVSYTVGGTATSGLDYQALPGSVTIPPGAASATIPVIPLDDTLVEPTETVVITLASDPAYFVGDGRTATAYIRDNDINTPPAVTLTGPADGAAFRDPTAIGLAAEASDVDGTVTRVDFYVNGVLLSTDTNAPYAASWSGMACGAYTLTARATDNMGAVTTSQPVTVSIDRTPVIRLTAQDTVAAEPGTDTGTIMVNRLNNTNGDVVVAYTVSGTATPGVDYAALPGTVTIPAGVTAVPLVIQPLDDALQEPVETVIVALSSNSAYFLGDPRSAVVYIKDDETNLPPAVALTSPADGALIVNPTNVLLSANATDADGAVARVDFYVNGSCLATDTNAPYAVTWSGMMQGTYTLTAKATDNLGAVTVSAPVTVNVQRTPVVRFYTADAYASEPGTDTGLVYVCRSYNTNDALVVSYTIGGTASNGVDYQAIPDSVTLPPGVFSVPLPIQPIDDAIKEPVETVVLTLKNDPAYLVTDPRSACVYISDDETNAAPSVALTSPVDGAVFADPSNLVIAADAADTDGSVVRVDFLANGQLVATDTNAPFVVTWAGMMQGTYTLTARATDNLGAVTVSAPVTVSIRRTPVVRLVTTDATAAEPGADTGVVQVCRAYNTNEDLVVAYTIGGTASNGVDYQWLPDHVTIPAGALSVPLVIRPIDDSIAEPYETVQLTLLANSAYLVGDPRSAVVYIKDDETNQAPRIALSTPADGASFTDPSNVVLAAEATDADGTVAHVDFYANNVLIASDSTAPYAINWSGMVDGTYVLTARATDNLGAAATSTPVTVRIVRTPWVRIAALDAYAAEAGTDPATVQVYRYYNTNVDLLVNYAVGGTASNGTDYAALPGSILIPAGSVSANIVIQPIDDALVEPTETVVLTLVGASASASPYAVADPRSATVYIRDNDTNTPPAVALTAPADGATLVDPTNIALRADASDPDGTVTRVDFLANTAVVGYATNAPFTASWSGMPQGTYLLTARATDNLGGQRVSEAVSVTVIRTPVLQVVATDSHASEIGDDPGVFTIYRRENTNAAITAAYVVGGTASNGVDYAFLGGTVTLPAGVLSTTVVVQPTADGPNNETATETVTLALVPDPAYRIAPANPAVVYIYDQITTNVPPRVALVAPTNGATLRVPSVATLRAEAADVDGSITRVDFLVNGAAIGCSTSAPYVLDWAVTNTGYYVLGARAADNRGAVTYSPSVRVLAAAPPIATATRYLPNGYMPATRLVVPIGVTQTAGAGAYSITERPPAGWAVSGIGNGGFYVPDEGAVHFGPFTNASVVLTYELTPPPAATGTQVFAGVVSTESAQMPVKGPTTLGPVPPHPADATPADWNMTLAEAGAYADAWLHSTVPGGANAPSGSTALGYVARAGYLWRHGGAYTLSTNAPTPLPPMVWVTDPTEPAAPLYASAGYGTAVASMPTNYVPGTPFTVRLAIAPASTTSVFAIEEHLPAGWSASNVSDAGVVVDRSTVRWGLFVDGQPCVVSYDVTPATNTTASATYGSFCGIVSFDGVNVTVSGMRRTMRMNP